MVIEERVTNIYGGWALKETNVELRITEEFGPGLAQECGDSTVCFWSHVGVCRLVLSASGVAQSCADGTVSGVAQGCADDTVCL